MATKYGTGQESTDSQALLRKRKELTESGHPELAPIAKPYWDTAQAAKTQDKIYGQADIPVRKTEAGKYGEDSELSPHDKVK